jgi:hypothetical protein
MPASENLHISRLSHRKKDRAGGRAAMVRFREEDRAHDKAACEGARFKKCNAQRFLAISIWALGQTKG